MKLKLSELANTLKAKAEEYQKKHKLDKPPVFAAPYGTELTSAKADYVVSLSGAHVRTTPKPWKGKSERRMVIKQRRAQRANEKT